MTNQQENITQQPSTCPTRQMSFADVARYMQDGFDEPVQRALSAHIQYCNACQDELDRVQAIMSTGRHLMGSELVESEASGTDSMLSEALVAAYLDGNLLTVPVVVVGEQFYSAVFELNTAATPAQLTLVDAYELLQVNTIGASSFHDNALSIPDIRIEGENYWIKFELLDNTAFVLLDYGFNDFGLGRNPIGLTQQPDWQRTAGKANDVGIGAAQTECLGTGHTPVKGCLQKL